MDGVTSRDDPPTVLIVEDEEGLADLFTTWLEDAYDVSVAHDCATGYDLLDETVDVALLDRKLPDGHGDDVLQYIRDEGYDCRVGMVTAVQPTFDIVGMGFDEYLIKPTSKAELRDAVEQLVAQADYGEAVTELYGLASKKALLETEYSRRRLSESDEYAEIETRHEELQQQLDVMMDSFSERQFAAESTRVSVEGD